MPDSQIANDNGSMPSVPVGVESTINNELEKKIIVIGLHGFDDRISLVVSSKWLYKNRNVNIITRLRNEDYEVFDMSKYPERGDALDHIDNNTMLVIALHVCGLRLYDNEQRPAGKYKRHKQYCYDRNNYQLPYICMEAGASLIAWGEQPEYVPVNCKATKMEDCPVAWLYEPLSVG